MVTRRDLLKAAAGAPAVLVPSSQPLPASNLEPPPAPHVAESRKMLAHVPTALELARWEHDYRQRYARDHAIAPYLRGSGIETEYVSEVEYDARTMAGAIDTLARLEAEVPKDVSVNHGAIAMARGDGFAARRGELPATANPFGQYNEPGDAVRAELDYDLHMAWYAGWVQADPNVVVPRSPGYTPPPVARCMGCGERLGHFHAAGSVCMAKRTRNYRVRLNHTPPPRRVR